MKLHKYLLLTCVIALATSCGKDDEDPQPNLEEASISLSENNQVVSVPSSMTSSEDPHAQMATQWVTLANSMSAQLAMFKPPSGATKSETEITPVNGRTAAGKALVYIWSDPNYGRVAYQVKDASTKYTFELFIEGDNNSGWYRYLYAEEAKDRSAGYMVVYDIWGFISEDGKGVLFRWDWSRSGDDFTFKMSDSMSEFKYTLTINTKTNAGSIVYFEGENKLYEISWTGQGAGTWKQYEDNVVIEEGSWQ